MGWGGGGLTFHRGDIDIFWQYTNYSYFIHLKTDLTVYVEHWTYDIACVLQGEFPDTNTQDDGYVGVAPVDAFPAQNKFGKIYDLR